VLDAPSLGLLLDVEPHPFGVWLTAEHGRRKTIKDAVSGVAGHQSMSVRHQVKRRCSELRSDRAARYPGDAG
jgi:hypothetical protein